MLQHLSVTLAAVILFTVGAVSALEKKPSDMPAQGGQSVDRPSLPNRCPNGEVFFSGQCQHTRFFQRFLTKGAELFGVAGPPASDSDDTGVIVVELFAENSFQLLYILPTKHAAGEPLNLGYQYRADYPVVFSHSVLTWQDDAGYLHVFSHEYGPTSARPQVTSPSGAARLAGSGGLSRFGSMAWTHYIRTASGYTTRDSNGRVGLAIASGGSGSYCEVGAVGAGVFAAGICAGGALAASSASSVWLGVTTGAVVFAVSDVLSAGTGTPAAAALGVGAGATVGAGAFGALNTTGTFACGLLGALTTKVVETSACSDTPNATTTATFVPVEPVPPVSPDAFGLCSGGTVLYTGEATTCNSKNSITHDPKEGDIETITVECNTMTINNKCVYF